MKKNKIVVVGGCGHIGLPLAVSLANAGFEVVAYDKNNDSINIAKTGKMPFFEKDGDLQLSIAIQSDNLKFQSVLDERSFGSDFIITIGTPVDEFLNPSLKIF